MKRRFIGGVLTPVMMVSLTCGTVGCSASGKKNEAISNGATVGAVSGAALGGGIGAIVGSTSGHLGEGVAVGALAGGVAGAGVGAAVGDYRFRKSSRADSVADQDKEFQEQRRELDSVKDSLGDDVGGSRVRSENISIGNEPPSARNGMGRGRTAKSYGQTSSAVKTASTSSHSSTYGILEGYRGNPKAKPFRSTGGASIPSSVMASKKSGSQVNRVAWNSGTSATTANAERRARLGHQDELGKISNKIATKPSNTLSTGDSVDQDLLDRESGEEMNALSEPPIRKVTSTGKVIQKEVASAEKSITAPVTTDSVRMGSGLPAANNAVNSALSSGDEAISAAERSIEKGTNKAENAVVAKQLGKLPADASATCIQAEKEAARASNASSDADRLFYLGRASRLCPTSDTYQVELGKVFAKIGKVQEAKSAFRRASELNPQNDVAHDELSILENTPQ